jgi:hypothetical protein
MAMKHDWLLKYALPALLISVAVAGGIYQTWQHQHTTATRITCNSPAQGCQFLLDQQSVKVEFVEPPSGLHPFILRVTIAHAQEIHAHFTMKEMEMGYNQYRLLALSPQQWQARVVLPVCVTGRHDWILTLNIDGKQVEIPFNG